MKEDLTSFLPLSAATLHILLALAGDDLHGYAIMQEVSRQSQRRYRLGPGTLYDNLQKLLGQGLVHELDHRAADEDPRRRNYRLTSTGRAVLAVELMRLEGVIREGKARCSLPGQGKHNVRIFVSFSPSSSSPSMPRAILQDIGRGQEGVREPRS